MNSPTPLFRAHRDKLPNRRPNETFNILFEGSRYHVTVGYFADGRPGEIFCHGAKVGSGMDLLIDDACVALSMLLQHGADPMALAHSMGRLGGGAPASIIGALAVLVAGAGGAPGEDPAEGKQPIDEGMSHG